MNMRFIDNLHTDIFGYFYHPKICSVGQLTSKRFPFRRGSDKVVAIRTIEVVFL